MSESEIQEQLYEYPYHHIPTVDGTGAVVLHRSLSWGFEYMCYLLHIQDIVSGLRPESVLDVGCGDGRLLSMQNGPTRRLGVDLSERAIRFARAFDSESQYDVADAADLTETFDVVIAMEVLEHIPDAGVHRFIGTLAERTRPGGHVIISVPTVVVPINPKHYRHYDIDLLRRQLEASGAELRIERIEYVYRHSRWIRAYRRVMESRFWYVDVPCLRRRMWQYTWSRLRVATAANGRHLVVLLQREAVQR